MRGLTGSILIPFCVRIHAWGLHTVVKLKDPAFKKDIMPITAVKYNGFAWPQPRDAQIRLGSNALDGVVDLKTFEMSALYRLPVECGRHWKGKGP